MRAFYVDPWWVYGLGVVGLLGLLLGAIVAAFSHPRRGRVVQPARQCTASTVQATVSPDADRPRLSPARVAVLRVELEESLAQLRGFSAQAQRAPFAGLASDFVALADKASKRSQELAELLDQAEAENDDGAALEAPTLH